MRLHVKQLPCPRAEFEAKLAAYLAEREAHKSTVGVPAPFPEFEIMRAIADQGGACEIYDDPPPAEPTPEERTAAELASKREAALRSLDDARLVAAAADPDAPQAVKDYAEAIKP